MNISEIPPANSNTDQGNFPIAILIRSDHNWKFISWKVIKPKTRSGTAAVDSTFGYIRHGNYEANATFINLKETLSMKVVAELHMDEKLCDNLKIFREVESVKVKEQKNVSGLK